MCSIFGFVGRKGNIVDLDSVRSIVEANIGRGPHAFGFSWVDVQGRLRCWKAPGNPLGMISSIRMMADAVMLVGHLRYSTHGNPKDNINNHPHPCDGGWLVHNGVVHDYRELIHKYRLVPTSSCDSEIIGMLAERSPEKTAMGRMLAAVEAIDNSPLAVMGLWTRKRQLIAIRRGNPLHIVEDDKGWWLASLAAGLPGKRGDVLTVKDDTAIRFTQRGIMVDIEQDVVRSKPARKRPAAPAVRALSFPPASRAPITVEDEEFEWWKGKAGSRAGVKPRAKGPKPGDETLAADLLDEVEDAPGDETPETGARRGVNADGTTTGEYRGG